MNTISRIPKRAAAIAAYEKAKDTPREITLDPVAREAAHDAFDRVFKHGLELAIDAALLACETAKGDG
jgi:hypothetical protein